MPGVSAGLVDCPENCRQREVRRIGEHFEVAAKACAALSQTHETSALRADGVTKRYGPRVALAGVSLDVAVGECVALIGESGSCEGPTVLQVLVVGFVPAVVGGLFAAFGRRSGR